MSRAAFTGFQAGKQQQAATRIREILETYGYKEAEVEDLIKRLQDQTVVSDVGGVPLSSASKTGDPVLQAIEFSLANSLQGVSEKQRQANKQAAVALTAATNALRDSGDPNNVRLAAQMFYDVFESKLSTRLMERVGRFTDAVKKVRRDADATEVSEGLFNAVNTNLRVARDEEARIWGRVGDVPVTAYLDENGNQIADPQFLRTFMDRVESSAFDALTDENKQELGVLVKIADEALTQLGTKPLPPPPEQAALDAARNSFKDALRRSAGDKTTRPLRTHTKRGNYRLPRDRTRCGRLPHRVR
jgi:hypothetical protein